MFIMHAYYAFSYFCYVLLYYVYIATSSGAHILIFAAARYNSFIVHSYEGKTRMLAYQA